MILPCRAVGSARGFAPVPVANTTPGAFFVP